MPKKKTKPVRQPNNTLHIYCEGEKSEPNYLRQYLQRQFSGDKSRQVVTIQNTRKNTPKQLVDVAVALRCSDNFLPGDQIWVVYDREAVAKYSDQLHANARKKAKDNQIEIALSNVCFELWLLLHFEATTTAYSSCDDLLANSRFKQRIRELGVADYSKADAALLEKILAKVADARSNAARMNQRTREAAPAGTEHPHQLNPYTQVHELLDAIDAFKAKGKA